MEMNSIPPAVSGIITLLNANRILPALFQAVLADFPSPPKGVRKVIVKLPGA